MSVIAKEILKQYITCEDDATRNKFFNMLDSFWHKIEGKIIKSYTKDAQGTITGMTVLDKDGVSESVAFPVFPNSAPISFIQELSTELGKLQPKVAGKGLSSNDLTLELLNKLNSLQNYTHPEFHQISEIELLAEALIAKQDVAPEGYGFSQENFTLPEKELLAAYNISHYGNPVNDLAELAQLTQADISNKQRRYVHSERCDYFYDAIVVDGDVAPLDQTLGTGFWLKTGETAESIKNKYESNANTNGFTDAEKAKLAGIDAAHYGAPVQDLAILTAIPEAELTDKERRYVEDKTSDYFYDLQLAAPGPEDVAPNDQTGGTGYWRKTGLGGETAASIKTKYESNPDTNPFSDANRAKVEGLPVNVESTEGATTKANQAESNANSYSDLNKVAKVAGKGLSDTNFTQIEKDKLSNLNFSRPSKIIDQTTQYTLVLEDKTKHLKILYPINLIYPAGVFAADDEIQFKNHSSGDVTMVEAATVTLEVVASQTLKVPAKGFGGGRYESATKVGVFGQLKPI